MQLLLEYGADPAATSHVRPCVRRPRQGGHGVMVDAPYDSSRRAAAIRAIEQLLREYPLLRRAPLLLRVR